MKKFLLLPFLLGVAGCATTAQIAARQTAQDEALCRTQTRSEYWRLPNGG
jgi:hypothetical protein